MMRKSTVRKIAGVIAGILVAALLISVLSTVFYVKADAADSISSLKSQLSQLDEEKKALEKKIADTKQSLQSASEKKEQIDEQVSVTQTQIDATQELIDQLDSQIQVKADELKVAEAKLEAQEELYKQRVRVMYEDGQISYLDVLLNAKSFSDMLSRLEIIQQVMTYDENLVDTYTALKDEVAAAKESLESDRQEQKEYMANLQIKKSELDDQLAESQAIYNSLNGNLAAQQAEANKVEEKKDYLNYEIRMMSQKEAAKSQASSGSSSSSSSSGGGSFSGSFQWPLPGHSTITSPYGYRTHPITGKYKLHTGTDISAPNGTAILAAGGGTVVKSCMTTAYGNYVIVNHGGGVMTAYAHMSRRSVSVGDKVSAGQQLGCVGSTGWSTGNHLHFEVIVNGSFTNPMGYF